MSAAYLQHMIDHPYRRDGQSLHGRLGLERRALQINDVLADPNFGRQDAQRIEGFRSTMGAPMMLDDEVIGVLLVWRTDVDPFEDRAITLLTAFAAAAAIAVRNLDLVRALETRSAELAHKVDQLEALGKLGEAVSSSLDLGTVLSTIVMHAVQMSRHRRWLVDGVRRGRAALLRAHGVRDERRDPRAAAQRRDLRSHDTFVGRAALEGRPLQVADLSRPGPRRPSAACCSTPAGGRWWPCRCCAKVRSSASSWCGGMSPGDFPEETCELLQTFASQSALAILNARLFRDLEEKTRRVARWPAATSRSSSPACRTSCAPRSTRSSGSRRCCSTSMFGEHQRASARVPPGHLELGQAPPPAPQRHPRPVQGRGRADGTGERRVLRPRGARVRRSR